MDKPRVEAAKEYRAGRDGKSYRVLQRAFEMLERRAVKVACVVLRGGKCRKAPTYPEQTRYDLEAEKDRLAGRLEREVRAYTAG